MIKSSNFLSALTNLPFKDVHMLRSSHKNVFAFDRNKLRCNFYTYTYKPKSLLHTYQVGIKKILKLNGTY